MANKVHVKKGDIVMVISGKDAGTKGKVLSVMPKEKRVIVEKVNVIKRHTKPTKDIPQGGIIEKPAPIASSNVMMYCSKCKAPVRIKKQQLSDGSYIRVCSKCGDKFN